MDSYFIDFDNIGDLQEDMYHVYFGDPDEIDYADFVASFGDEHDAREYVQWKNEEDSGDDGYNDYEEEDEDLEELDKLSPYVDEADFN